MSDAADAYIDELRDEKRQLKQINQMLQAAISTRQQIDRQEGRTQVPALPFGMQGMQITIDDLGNHINDLGRYLAQLQQPPSPPAVETNGTDRAALHEVLPAPAGGGDD